MTDKSLYEPQGLRGATLFLASNGGLGYAPFAPGTFGTLAGIPAFYYLSRFPWPLELLTLVGLIFLSFRICDIAGVEYGDPDDSRIVIDELAGYLVTTLFLPFSWGAALLAFFWFRVFDILKPPPVSWFDREWPNGFGVTLDDVIAGLYAAVMTRFFLALFS